MSKEMKETKEQYFERVAARRVEGVVKAIEILGRCSKRGQYGYTQELAGAMFSELRIKLEDAEMLFDLPDEVEPEPYSFCFGNTEELAVDDNDDDMIDQDPPPEPEAPRS